MAGQSTEPVIDFALLPGQLKVIAKYCGDECMWAVWRHYGGGHLSVPELLDERHPIAVTLGVDYARRLVEHFAPKTLYIAKGNGAQLAMRNAVRNLAIMEERKRGYTLFAIARKYDLSERQVINILKSVQQMPSANIDIFEM